jgi:hypothetical protein
MLFNSASLFAYTPLSAVISDCHSYFLLRETFHRKFEKPDQAEFHLEQVNRLLTNNKSHVYQMKLSGNICLSFSKNHSNATFFKWREHQKTTCSPSVVIQTGANNHGTFKKAPRQTSWTATLALWSNRNTNRRDNCYSVRPNYCKEVQLWVYLFKMSITVQICFRSSCSNSVLVWQQTVKSVCATS